MKKLFCLMLVVLLAVIAGAGAFAEVPRLSDNMFAYAKGALSCLASGDYEKIVTKLPFSDVSPSAEEWRNFARGSFSGLDSVQGKYAVAYWSRQVWKIAVPVSEPDNGGVETFILVSEDGSSFTGYGFAYWGEVEREYQSSSYVIWNDEYNGSTSAVVEADID